MKVVFYIGTDRRHVDPTFRRHFAKGQEIRFLSTLVAQIFGNGTIQESHGVWTDCDNDVVIEPSFTVTVLADPENTAERLALAEKITAFVNQACIHLQQRVIAVETQDPGPAVKFMEGKR